MSCAAHRPCSITVAPKAGPAEEIHARRSKPLAEPDPIVAGWHIFQPADLLIAVPQVEAGRLEAESVQVDAGTAVITGHRLRPEKELGAESVAAIGRSNPEPVEEQPTPGDM